MGGDRAPEALVAGAVRAVAEGGDICLVGDQDVIGRLLAEHAVDIPIVHAAEMIAMGDDPARAIRARPDSSVAVAARLVASGEAAGFVSAGSTGAALAAAAIIVGRIPGVRRPAIASIWPTPPTPTVVVDSGANPDPRAEHLLQFAVMGSIMAEVVLGMTAPRVGLLSNGEEAGKGRQLERDAFSLIADSGLNFVGNVEGRDVGTDRADVIVTDGFTGNVFLKAVEGTARMVASLVAESLEAMGEVRELAMPALTELRRRMDPETYGGGHLVGVNGIVVIAHGSSTASSVQAALRMATEAAEADLVGVVADRLDGR